MTGRQSLTGRHLMTGVLIALLTGIQPTAAKGSSFQQGSPQPAPAPPPAPYKKLFQPPPLDQAARAQRREQDARTAAPRVLGGMPVIPLDPCIDPKIFIGQSPGDARYTIRVVPLLSCR